MMIQTVLIIFCFAFPVTIGFEVPGPDNDHHASSRSTLTYPSCFKEDTTWSTMESTMIPGVEDPYSCQSSCHESATCHHFTWYNQQAFPLNLACFLYDQPTQEYPCTNCVSGPQSCTCSDFFTCQPTQGNFVGEIPHVETENLCQDHCFKTTNCTFYTWLDQDSDAFPNLCLLFSSCQDKFFNCIGCHSGPVDCDNMTSTTTTSISTPRPTTPPTTSTLTPTTTTTPAIITTTTSDCHVPEPQKHGDWFCPPSTEATSCHLECHPGYTSNNVTVITCQHGEWSSAPSCVAAVALITGNANSPSNTAEVYSEGLHLLLPDLPDNRREHSVELVDSAVLLCGGWYTRTSCLVLTSSQQWVHHSTTTSTRWAHSSVSALGQLHLLGGYDSSSRPTSEYLTRSSTTWSEGWQLLEGSYRACTAKVDPEVAIMTGGDSHRSSVISYNVTSGAARRLQDLISPRYAHGCCYIRDVGFRGVLVAGGYGGDKDFSQLYDINAGEWATTGTLTTDRDQGLKLFVIGEQILASGGYSGGYLSTVDRFNLTSRTWKAAEDMLEARSWHAVTGVPPSAVGIGPN